MRILTTGASAAAVVLALCSPASGQSAAPPDAWPQFRATPELGGASRTTLPDELQLLWKLFEILQLQISLPFGLREHCKPTQRAFRHRQQTVNNN